MNCHLFPSKVMAQSDCSARAVVVPFHKHGKVLKSLPISANEPKAVVVLLRNSGYRLGDGRLSEVARMGGEVVSDFLAGGGEMGALTQSI